MKKLKEYIDSLNPQKALWTVIGLILLATIFWSSYSLQRMFFDSVDKINIFINDNPLIGILIFIGLAAISAMFSPFSSVPLIPFAILIWGEVGTFFLLLTGWLIGGSITYIIGRYAGRPIVTKLLSENKLDYFLRKIPRKAEFWLVLLFRLSMPAEIPGYITGILKIPFWMYFVASIIGEGVIAVGSIYASEALINADPIMFIVAAAAIVGWMSIFFYHFKKALA
ncbi:TVP38/TMEM64 family protein [Candidatus Woesearchaeota archaeon]|nr:TVP38/TMEM64 family protein [Candidatus Woesearchaeota archaeon]